MEVAANHKSEAVSGRIADEAFVECTSVIHSYLVIRLEDSRYSGDVCVRCGICCGRRMCGELSVHQVFISAFNYSAIIK